MISNAEIERYRKFAELQPKVGRGSEDASNLALMVINLIEVIDHLAGVSLNDTAYSPSKYACWCGDSNCTEHP